MGSSYQVAVDDRPSLQAYPPNATNAPDRLLWRPHTPDERGGNLIVDHKLIILSVNKNICVHPLCAYYVCMYTCIPHPHTYLNIHINILCIHAYTHTHIHANTQCRVVVSYLKTVATVLKRNSGNSSWETEQVSLCIIESLLP